MVLYTNNYLEYYLTLVGWLINGAIWDMIGSTGLFAAPFAAIVIQEWLRARGEGQDEGNKGVLSLARIENRFYVAIFVIMLGLMPTPKAAVSFSTLEYDKTRSQQCQVDVLKPSETGWGTSFSTHWATRLRYQQPRLLRFLQKAPEFAGLMRLQFKMQPNPGTATRPRPVRQVSQVGADSLREVAAGIRDPKLKAALERLASRSGSQAAPDTDGDA